MVSKKEKTRYCFRYEKTWRNKVINLDIPLVSEYIKDSIIANRLNYILVIIIKIRVYVSAISNLRRLLLS